MFIIENMWQCDKSLTTVPIYIEIVDVGVYKIWIYDFSVWSNTTGPNTCPAKYFNYFLSVAY